MVRATEDISRGYSRQWVSRHFSESLLFLSVCHAVPSRLYHNRMIIGQNCSSFHLELDRLTSACVCWNAWSIYRKVVYKSYTWLEASLEWKPHSLLTQVSPKTHSNRSRGLKKAAYCRRCRTKSYRISHAKCLFTFEIIFEQSRAMSSFIFILHVADRIYGFCRL